ncbi:MAG: TRAP transporter small permease [Rhodospirillales bacterium]
MTENSPGPQPPAPLPAWLAWPRRMIEMAAVAMITVMMLATLAQVAFRYLLEISVPWTEELSRILFVVAMFLTMGIAIREKENIVVDFLLRKAGPRPRMAIAILFDIVILGFLFIWARGALALISLNLGSSLVTLPVVSVGYLYACELLGVVLMALYVAVDLVENVRQIAAPARGGRA